MTPAPPIRSARGFTLVETIVALTLLGLGILALAPLFTYASRGAAAGGEMGEVGALAVERLEGLRGTPYSALIPGGSLTSSVTGYSDITDPEFVVRWQIASNAGTPNTKIITLRALATRQAAGARRDVTLITMRAK
jgi:prepilin-type N-terminal cleavage/methylation domain-containing protein